MGKIDHRRLSRKDYEELEREFTHVLQKMGMDTKNARAFRELFTKSEMVMLTRRIQIARRILIDRTFEEIRAELGTGNATMNFVALWMDNVFPGYGDVLEKVQEAQKENNEEYGSDYYDYIDPQGFRALRRRYPMHFLLFNMVLGDPKPKRSSKTKK